MEMRDIVLLAWSNKKKLIIIPLLVGLLTLSVLQMKQTIYEARGVIAITDRSLAPWMDPSDRASAENEFAYTYSHLMKLRPFLDDVSKRLPYETDPIALEQAIKIEYTYNSNVLIINARSKNPEQAALLVNNVIDYFPLYLNKIQMAQPVTINAIEKAEAPGHPLSSNRISITVITFIISFLWILNIIMFSKCMYRELPYEQSL